MNSMCQRFVVIRATRKGRGVLVNCKYVSPVRWAATRSSPAISGPLAFGRQTACPSRMAQPGSDRLAGAQGGVVRQAPQLRTETNQNSKCNLLGQRQLRSIIG